MITDKNSVFSTSFPRTSPTFSSESVYRPVKTDLARTPKTDEIVRTSTGTKVALSLAGLVTAGIGIALSAKGIKSAQTKKALAEIEARFQALKDDIPNVQKKFKEIFLNDNLTEKETMEMLSRYQEIEKLSVTGSKEEYIKALFNEAHKNYGLKPIKLIIESPEKKTVGGGTSAINEYVSINPNIKTETLIDVIHHELRHVKQHELAYNQVPDKAPMAIATLAYIKDPAIRKEAEEFTTSLINKNILGRELREKFSEKYKSVFMARITESMGELSPKNVPESQKEYAEKIMESLLDRDPVKYSMDHNYYLDRFFEIDARFAGETMAKLFSKPTYIKH